MARRSAPQRPCLGLAACMHASNAMRCSSARSRARCAPHWPSFSIIFIGRQPASDDIARCAADQGFDPPHPSPPPSLGLCLAASAVVVAHAYAYAPSSPLAHSCSQQAVVDTVSQCICDAATLRLSAVPKLQSSPHSV